MTTSGAFSSDPARWNTDAPATPPPEHGSLVTARPMSMRQSFTGTVVETDGPTIVLKTATGMLVAVHLLDCSPAT